MEWLRKGALRSIGFMAFILVICVLIFPIIFFYALSNGIARGLDKLTPRMHLTKKNDHVWDAIVGAPYDYFCEKTTGSD